MKKIIFIFVLSLALFFMGFCYYRSLPQLKLTKFVFSYTEQIPTSCSYYFKKGCQDNENLEVVLDNKQEIGVFDGSVKLRGNVYPLVFEIIDDEDPVVNIKRKVYVQGKDASIEDLLDITDKSDYKIITSSDLNQVSEGYNQLIIMVRDSSGNTTKITEEFMVINQESITYGWKYDYLNNSLEQLIAKYLEDKQISSSNIALVYRNFHNDDEYSLNKDEWYLGGSTYKVPLNMLYQEMLNENKISLDTKLPYTEDCHRPGFGPFEQYYQINDMVSLDVLMMHSLYYSSETTSYILFKNLGGYSSFKHLITKYSDTTAYEDKFFKINYFTANYLADTLEYLYLNSSEYELVLNHLKEAMPKRYLKQFIKYPVAHKYGIYTPNNHDIGIIYTDRPFLLVVLTKNLDNYEKVIGELGAIVTLYHLHH